MHKFKTHVHNLVAQLKLFDCRFFSGERFDSEKYFMKFERGKCGEKPPKNFFFHSFTDLFNILFISLVSSCCLTKLKLSLNIFSRSLCAIALVQRHKMIRYNHMLIVASQKWMEIRSTIRYCWLFNLLEC